MTSKEIRQSFLDFFRLKEHKIVPSSPVVPYDDPTLLFTNAGMNQFKDVFLGLGNREYNRAADTQKCIRVSGKHNDLEEVGVDTYHHTFFEMLGNWSFGDYYKQEAIDWAWELLTKEWKLDTNRLHATVYRTDDEAYELWTKYLPNNRIHRFDEKDNFWEMGDTGPCGPCSEIHYDRTPDLSGGNLVNAGVPEVIEIWNLVFIQYNRKADGSLEELSAKHVDTGMGFERIVAVIQNKESNYDSDVFSPIIQQIEELSGKKYSQALDNPVGIAMRVIADHIRTLSFAIADGAAPGNEGRGYVLRRILRRGSRFARNLGFREPVLYKLVDTLRNNMSEVFPELDSQAETIKRIVKAEEESFLQTLDKGIEKFNQIAEKIKNELNPVVPGDEAFQLYDTFGFPLDLTELLARESGFAVDIEGFHKLMQEQKSRSRAARKVITQEVETENIDFTSNFVGYNFYETESKVLYVKGNQIVLEETPFYAESGGQVSDTGTIFLGGENYKVIEVKKINDAIIHICVQDIEPLVGKNAIAKVDKSRRRDIMRNHTATHLLHEALRQVLGNHVQQSGSLVAPDYLRFDFTHYEKVTSEDLAKIENMVNDKILDSISVQTLNLTLDEARERGDIKMFFGDKYGENVRAIVIDNNFSKELCGGTHVQNTAEIGFMKIVSESSISAGIRRIEAVTGKAVNNYINSLNEKVQEARNHSKQLFEKIKQLEKEIAKSKQESIANEFDELIKDALFVNDIKVVSKRVTLESLEELRNTGEKLRNLLNTNGIGLLATVFNEKVQLVCVVTDDLKSKLPAGKLVGEAAKFLGGGGGGKPHLATAGAKDISKVDELISEFPEIIKNSI